MASACLGSKDCSKIWLSHITLGTFFLIWLPTCFIPMFLYLDSLSLPNPLILIMYLFHCFLGYAHHQPLSKWCTALHSTNGLQEPKKNLDLLPLQRKIQTRVYAHAHVLICVAEWIKNSFFCSDWCGSVDWASSHKAKGYQFVPGEGTCLGCQFGPGRDTYKQQPVVISFSHRCFSPFLSPSFPLSLKIIHTHTYIHKRIKRIEKFYF